MFSFLNRQSSKSDIKPATAEATAEQTIQAECEEIQRSLYKAIINKRTDIVVTLINEWFKAKKDTKISVKYFFNYNYCEQNTTNPLIVAYTLKDRDIMRALLSLGADPSLIDVKHKKCLTQLIKEDASDDQMKQLLNDSFMQAIVQNNLTSLNQFLTSGFELNSSCLPDGNTYLHWAAMYSTEPVVRVLLEHGSDVNGVNKFGATPLHECIAKKKLNSDEAKAEALAIVETLLSYKADPFGVKGTSGQFKDKTSMDMASDLHHLKQEPSIYNLIKEFNSDSLSTNSSNPNSPLSKTFSAPAESSPTKPPLTKTTSIGIINALNSISLNQNNSSESSENMPPLQKTPPKMSELERSLSWSTPLPQMDKEFETETARLAALLWPRPQTCIVFDDSLDDRFLLNDAKSHPMNVFIKPPFTYAYMDFINRIANSFGGMDFMCIHKPPPMPAPYISVTVDRTLFQRENAYSLLVTKSKIEINAVDEVALQYALFTFMQLCKIYARTNIPSLRILDYSDVKYRAVLFDFSQGYYFKYEYFLSVLQMLTFYKMNQVHFYVKFSSLPPENNKLQWYHSIKNWFGLMKFCEEVNLQVVPSIDIANDVAEIDDVLHQIKEYLDLFQGYKFVNIGPRLTNLLACMDNKNPFSLDSDQYMMLCSYLYHAGDSEMLEELDKIDKSVFMEYGLKCGNDFGAKSSSLYKSGRPFFYCVGSSNWNSLLGQPEVCLHNIFDAVSRQSLDNPNGLVLCNFSGSLYKNAFAFNLNSMVMLAGCSWNTKIKLDEVKYSLPKVILTHGLISQSDGEIGVVMLELGKLETFLTRKVLNLDGFTGLPCDIGSLFIQMLYSPDEIELDYLDKSTFKNVLFQLRAHQSKLKSLLATSRNHLFKEVAVSIEIAINLYKFLYTLYIAGTRHPHNLNSHRNSVAGLSVVNIGVANSNITARTDLANKLILLLEEYGEILPLIYSEESTDKYLELSFNGLIEKLLTGQHEANTVEYSKLIKYKRENIEEKRKMVNGGSTSHYFVQEI